MVSNGRQTGTVRKRDSGATLMLVVLAGLCSPQTQRSNPAESPPPGDLTAPPALKKRKPAQPDSEGEETQDATTQETVASAALDLFTPAQEADWDALVEQALHGDAATKVALYGDNETVLSREQLRARRLQAITRLAQTYQVWYGIAAMVHTHPLAARVLEPPRGAASPCQPHQTPRQPSWTPHACQHLPPAARHFRGQGSFQRHPHCHRAAPPTVPGATAGWHRRRSGMYFMCDSVGLSQPRRQQGKPEEPAPPADREARQEVVALCDDTVAEAQGEEEAACGRGLDVTLPTYEQVEQWLLSKEEAAASAGLPAKPETLLRWRAAFLQRLPSLLRLEQVWFALVAHTYTWSNTQVASALAARALDGVALPDTPAPRPFNALASLTSRSRQYLLLASAVELGRRSKTRGSVDIDLSEEPDACKLSRRSARIVLQADGRFALHNVGRRYVSHKGLLGGWAFSQLACSPTCIHRHVRVNDVVVHPGAQTPLPHLSLVSMVNVHLLFTVNEYATRRLKQRAQKLVQML